MFFSLQREVQEYLHNYRLMQQSRKPVIIWYHLGLGDQVLMARVLETWSQSHVKIHVPAKKRNIDSLRQLYSYLSNVIWHEISDDPNRESEDVHALAASLQLPTVNAGQAKLLMLRRIFPELGLNQLLALSANVLVNDLSSARMRAAVLGSEGIERLDYAFVDWRPGTSRAIDERNLTEIRNRGLEIVVNDVNSPFTAIAPILAQAQELHLVGSAPLCLAMVLGIQPKSAFFYRLDNAEGLRGDDPSGIWVERFLDFGLVDQDGRKKISQSTAPRGLRWLRRLVLGKTVRATD